MSTKGQMTVLAIHHVHLGTRNAKKASEIPDAHKYDSGYTISLDGN